MANPLQKIDLYFKNKNEVEFSRALLLSIGDKCIAKCVENDKKSLQSAQKDCLELCVDSFFHAHSISSNEYLTDYRNRQK